MCGVFGFLATGAEGVDLDQLAELALSAESRGRHAHGLAWVDRAGRLRRFKAPGPISGNLGCLEFVRHAVAIVGHCRHATRGDPLANENNHPHPADGGWIVHNGTVLNAESLVRRLDLPASTACDSEVLGLLVEHFEGGLAERLEATINATDGEAAILGVWTRPLRMAIVRRGKPLHVERDDERGVYWASLGDALPSAEPVEADSLTVWTARGGRLQESTRKVTSWRNDARKPTRRRSATLFR